MTNLTDPRPTPLSPQDQPPIRDEEDLRAAWERLLGPLGFEERVLWVLLMDDAGTCLPVIPQVDSFPELPTEDDADGLIHAFGSVLPPDGSLAVLITGPGDGIGPEAERRWARELAGAAARAGVRCHRVFAADDRRLRAVDPGDDPL